MNFAESRAVFSLWSLAAGLAVVSLLCVSPTTSFIDCPLHQTHHCPNETFYNETMSECQPCSVCKSPDIEVGECGRIFCGKPVDRACCPSNHYYFFGRCFLDCRACNGGLGCKIGRTECKCPEDHSGQFCEEVKENGDTLKPLPAKDVESTEEDD